MSKRTSDLRSDAMNCSALSLAPATMGWMLREPLTLDDDRGALVRERRALLAEPKVEAAEVVGGGLLGLIRRRWRARREPSPRACAPRRARRAR